MTEVKQSNGDSDFRCSRDAKVYQMNRLRGEGLFICKKSVLNKEGESTCV